MILKTTTITFDKFLKFVNAIRYGKEYGLYHIAPDLNNYFYNVCKVHVINKAFDELDIELIELPGFIEKYARQQEKKYQWAIHKEFHYRLISLKSLYYKNFMGKRIYPNYPIYLTKSSLTSDLNKRKEFVLGRLEKKKKIKNFLKFTGNLSKLDIIKNHLVNNLINKNLNWYEYSYIHTDLDNQTIEEPSRKDRNILIIYAHYLFCQDYLSERSYNYTYAYDSYISNEKNKNLLLKKKSFFYEFIKLKKSFNLWYVSINSDNIFEKNYLNKITRSNKAIEFSYKSSKFKKLIPTKMYNDKFLYTFSFDYKKKYDFNYFNFVKKYKHNGFRSPRTEIIRNLEILNRQKYALNLDPKNFKKRFFYDYDTGIMHWAYQWGEIWFPEKQSLRSILASFEKKDGTCYKSLFMKPICYQTKTLRRILSKTIINLSKVNTENFKKFSSNRLNSRKFNYLRLTYLTPIKTSYKAISKLSKNEKRILLKQIKFYRYNNFLDIICNSYLYYYLQSFIYVDNIHNEHVKDVSYKNPSYRVLPKKISFKTTKSPNPIVNLKRFFSRNFIETCFFGDDAEKLYFIGKDFLIFIYWASKEYVNYTSKTIVGSYFSILLSYLYKILKYIYICIKYLLEYLLYFYTNIIFFLERFAKKRYKEAFENRFISELMFYRAVRYLYRKFLIIKTNFLTIKKQYFHSGVIKTHIFSKPYKFFKIKNNTVKINRLFYIDIDKNIENVYTSDFTREELKMNEVFYKAINKKPKFQIILEETSMKTIIGELTFSKPMPFLEYHTNKRSYDELNYMERFFLYLSKTTYYMRFYNYISNKKFLSYIIVNILYFFFKNTVILTEDGIVFYDTILTKESIFDYHEYLLTTDTHSKAKRKFTLLSLIIYVALYLKELSRSFFSHFFSFFIGLISIRNNLDFSLIIKRFLFIIKDLIELILAIIEYYRIQLVELLTYLAINLLTWQLFRNIYRELRYILYVGYFGYLEMPKRLLFDWESPHESSFFGIRTYFDFVICVGESIINFYMLRFWIQYDKFMYFMDPVFKFLYRVYIFVTRKIIRKGFIVFLYFFTTYFIFDLIYRRRLYHDYFLPLWKRVTIDKNNNWSCNGSDTETIEFLRYLQFRHERHITFKRWFRWIHVDKPLIRLNKYIVAFLSLLLYLIRTYLFPEVYGFTLVLLERINKLSYIIVYMILGLEKLDYIGWFFYEILNTYLYMKMPFGVVYHWHCYTMEYKGLLKLILYTPIYIIIIITQSIFIVINFIILLFPSILVVLDVLIEMYYNYMIELSRISPFAGRREHFDKYYAPRVANAIRSNFERTAESLIFRVDIKAILNRKANSPEDHYKYFGTEYFSPKENLAYSYNQRIGKLREKQFMRINYLRAAFKQEKSYLGTKSNFVLTTRWYSLRGHAAAYVSASTMKEGDNPNNRYNLYYLKPYATKGDITYRASPLELPNRYSRYFTITNKRLKSLYDYVPNYWFDREIDDMLEDSFESTSLDLFDSLEPNEDLTIHLKTKRHLFKYGIYDFMELDEETCWSEYTYKSLHRSIHEFLVIRDNFVDEVNPDRFFDYYKSDGFYDTYGNEITIEQFELKYKVPEYLDWRFNEEFLTLAYEFYDIYYEEHQYFEETWYKLKSRMNSIYNITDDINRQLSRLDLNLDYLKFKKLVGVKDFKLSRDFFRYKTEFYNKLEDQAYITEREKIVREIEKERRKIINKKKSKSDLEFIKKLESYNIYEDVEFTDQDIDRMNELFLKVESEINLQGLDLYKDYNKLLKIFSDKRRALREQLKEQLNLILQELLVLQKDYINKIKPKQINNFIMTAEQISKKNYLSLNEESIGFIKKLVAMLYKNDYNRNMSELATHINFIKYQLNCLDCDMFVDTLNFKYRDVIKNLRKLKIIKQKNLFKNEKQKEKAAMVVKNLLEVFNKDKLALLRKFNNIKKNKSENFFYNNYSLEIDRTNYYHVMYKSCIYNGIFTWLFGPINDYAVEDWYNWAFVYYPYLEYDSYMMPDGEYYEHEEDEDDEDEDCDETEDLDDETDGDYVDWLEDGVDQDDGVDLEDMLGWLHGEMYDYHIEKGGFKLRFKDKTFYYKETNYNFLIEFIDELKKSAKKLKINKNLAEHELTYFDKLLHEKQLIDKEGDLKILKMNETTPEEIELKRKEQNRLFKLAKTYIYVKRSLIFKQLRKIHRASLKVDDFRRPDKVFIPKGYWDREKDKEKYKEFARNRKLQLDMAYYKGETMLHRLNLLRGRYGIYRFPKGIYFSGILFHETALLYRLLRHKTLNYAEKYSIFPFFLIIEQLDKKYPNDPQRAIDEGFKIIEDIINKKIEARKRGEIYKSQTELDLEKPLFGQEEIKEEAEYVKNRDEGKYLF